jgi:small subunit ribosomal protein S6
MVRAYELMIIFDADAQDAAIEDRLKQMTTLVEADGGSVATVDKWGRRRFAYEINKKTEGIYVVVEIVTPASNLDALDRVLRLADETVRHKIIRLPEGEARRRGLIPSGAPAAAG